MKLGIRTSGRRDVRQKPNASALGLALEKCASPDERTADGVKPAQPSLVDYAVPSKNIKQPGRQYSRVLKLSQRQLEALIAVERPGLNAYVLLPEISPAAIPHAWIEEEAEKLIKKHCRTSSIAETDCIKALPAAVS